MTSNRGDWMLMLAGQPVRIRDSEQSTPEDLKSAAARPLGNLTFRLQNLAILGAFQPETHEGHKMVAKGALIRQTGGERISVTELEMASAECAR